MGDSVRRSQMPFSATIHHLLLHLEARSVVGRPRFRGVDAQGREIFSFIPGETGVPARNWQHDGALLAAAALLRPLHEATRNCSMTKGLSGPLLPRTHSAVKSCTPLIS